MVTCVGNLPAAPASWQGSWPDLASIHSLYILIKTLWKRKKSLKNPGPCTAVRASCKRMSDSPAWRLAFCASCTRCLSTALRANEKADLDVILQSMDCDFQRLCPGSCPTVQAVSQDEGTRIFHCLVSIRRKVFSPNRNLWRLKDTGRAVSV